MFEKFGEMESYTQINELANNLKVEGDIESLKQMAAENGIDADICDAFIQGAIPELTDAMSAAIGKIEIEEAELKHKEEIISDWINYIKASCMDSEDVAKAVRMKGKSLNGVIAYILTWSFKNAYAVDEDIVKAAKVSGRVKMGIPGMGTAKRLIKEYYTGGKNEKK